MLLKALRRLVRPDRYEARINLSQRRMWFADEQPAQPAAEADKKAQQPATQTGDKPTPEQPASAQDKEVPDWVKDPAKAYAEIQKLRASEAGYRTTANEAKAEKERLAAEKAAQIEVDLANQKKWEDLAKKAQEERDKLKSDLEKANLSTLRTRVGVEAKLPLTLIDRLKGSTEEELRADAAALVKDLGLDKPQPETQQPATTDKKKAGSQTTAVAPGGPPAGETDAERRARLYKQGAQATPIFSKPEK